VDELVPPQLRASGQVAARSVSFGLAPVVGAFAGGLVYGNVGPAAMFVGAALLAVLAAIVTLLPQQRRPGSP